MNFLSEDRAEVIADRVRGGGRSNRSWLGPPHELWYRQVIPHPLGLAAAVEEDLLAVDGAGQDRQAWG